MNSKYLKNQEDSDLCDYCEWAKRIKKQINREIVAEDILVGEKFLSECERLESAAHQNRQNIRLYQSELIPLIGTSNYSKCPAEKLEPK